VRDDLDLRFHDVVALEEIELYAEVLSAVAAADGPLTTEQIDEVLACASGPEPTRARAYRPPRSGLPARRADTGEHHVRSGMREAE
jgi:hypothetical protein